MRFIDMQPSSYYREQAERARRLADGLTHRQTSDMLRAVARDYEELAEDLELGAVELRHPELMPQRRHR